MLYERNYLKGYWSIFKCPFPWKNNELYFKFWLKIIYLLRYYNFLNYSTKREITNLNHFLWSRVWFPFIIKVIYKSKQYRISICKVRYSMASSSYTYNSKIIMGCKINITRVFNTAFPCGTSQNSNIVYYFKCAMFCGRRYFLNHLQCI